MSIKFAVIDSATSGNTTLVSADPGGKIRVLAINFIAAGAVNVAFTSAGLPITGPYPLVAQSGAALGYSPVGHFQTVENQALVMTLDAAVQVSGSLVYEIK